MRNLPWNRHREYPLLIEPTANALDTVGVPWVIENVMGAKLASGWLCGQMLGLPFYRHRFFWAGGWYWLQPPHIVHRARIRGGHTLAGRAREMAFNGQRAKDALGVTWMKGEREISSAIPPAYTEFIGRQLIQAILLSRDDSPDTPRGSQRPLYQHGPRMPRVL
jgi:DNA (cytosine-5)-methyltransferase 1